MQIEHNITKILCCDVVVILIVVENTNLVTDKISYEKCEFRHSGKLVLDTEQLMQIFLKT